MKITGKKIWAPARAADRHRNQPQELKIGLVTGRSVDDRHWFGGLRLGRPQDYAEGGRDAQIPFPVSPYTRGR